MNTVGQREILIQQRVVAFFRDPLGYAYLGDWQNRSNKRNIEPALLTDWAQAPRAPRWHHHQGLARTQQDRRTRRQHHALRRQP